MHELFQQLDFDHIPFKEDYKPFISTEYADKLFRSPTNGNPPLISRGGQGLGDIISTVQFAYHLAEELSTPVGVSWKAWKPREGVRRKLTEVIPTLGPDFEDRVFISDEVWCNYGKAMWPWYYSVPYFPAYQTHKDISSRIALLQLDGKTCAGQKNLPEGQVGELTDYLTNAGLKVVPWTYADTDGSVIPLKYWIETLANAEIFFGVDSGGAHMAHCTKTPKIVFINNYAHSTLDPKKSSHRNEAFVHFKDFHDFKQKIESL